MGLLEGLLYVIWRGVAIGIIISAPMGPVGILCVQRTLEKGRKTGLYTGIGAALSDIFYCLLTGFGLSFIEEFLERNSNIIQLVGSLVLIGFGFYLFKSNPSKNLKKPSNKHIPAGKNILSGFLFTFSNPLIIFLIIGLFARFNFLLPELKFFHYIIGFIAIIGGALLWWWVVTYFVDKVRAHFNLRSMWLINKITGSVILLFAIVGIFTAVSGLANAAEPVNRHKTPTDKIMLSNPGPDIATEGYNLNGAVDIDLKFRVCNLHNGERKNYSYKDPNGSTHSVKHPGWGIRFGDSELAPYVIIHTLSDPFDANYSSPKLQFIFMQGGERVADRIFTAGFNIFEGLNAYRIRINGGKFTMWGGNRRYDVIFTDIELNEKPAKLYFFTEPGGEICVEHISLRNIGKIPLDNSTEKADRPLPELETLKKSLSRSKDDKEGLWGLLDYNVEDKYLKIGGEYIVAIIKSENDSGCENSAGGYKIYYISGAAKYPDYWKYGALKGKLSPTPFKDIYNMEWVSSKGEKIKKEIKAEFDLQDMHINIPEYSSSVRFRKIFPR